MPSVSYLYEVKPNSDYIADFNINIFFAYLQLLEHPDHCFKKKKKRQQ